MAGSGGTFCFSDDQLAIDVDAATFKALAFENFQIAFQQIHSETSEDTWKENFSEDSDFESRPQQWFGSDLDSGGPVGRLDELPDWLLERDEAAPRCDDVDQTLLDPPLDVQADSRAVVERWRNPDQQVQMAALLGPNFVKPGTDTLDEVGHQVAV